LEPRKLQLQDGYALPPTKVLVTFTKMADVLPLLFQHSNMSTVSRGMTFVILYVANMEHVVTAQQKIYLENSGDKIKK
jgi:hypothetical protein